MLSNLTSKEGSLGRILRRRFPWLNTCILLITLGFLVNQIPVTLYYGADLIFGGVFSFLILRSCGFLPSIIGTLIITYPTVPLWGHHYALLLFTLEIVVIGALTTGSKKRPHFDLLTLVIIYWLTIGILTTWITYFQLLEVSGITALMIGFKQAFNSIVNAVIASLIFYYIPNRFRSFFFPWEYGGKIIGIENFLILAIVSMVLLPATISISILSNAKVKQITLDELKHVEEQFQVIIARIGNELEFKINQSIINFENFKKMTEKEVNSTEFNQQSNSSVSLMTQVMADGKISNNLPDEIFGQLPSQDKLAQWFKNKVRRMFLVEDGLRSKIVIYQPNIFSESGLLLSIPMQEIESLNSTEFADLSPRLEIYTEKPIEEGANEYTVLPFYKPKKGLTIQRAVDPDLQTLPALSEWEELRLKMSQKFSARDDIDISFVFSIKDIVYKHRSESMLIQLGFLLPIFISAIGISIIIRRITGPLGCLTSFVLSNEKGGELKLMEMRLPVPQTYEISQLAISIPRMVESISSQKLEQTRIASDLRALIDTANAPIFGIDAEGMVNEWNQSAERITGYSKDEVMGHGLVENFITDEYKASVKEVLDKALAGEQTANFSFPLYTKGGDRVDVLLNATTRRDEYKRCIGVFGVGQDITERTKIEKALKFERDNLENKVQERTVELRKLLARVEKTNELLKEADRHKSKFLSTMSHELRTPLNSIIGFTDLLKGQFFGNLNEKQLGYVIQINESGKLLLDLITDLLDLSKIDSGIVNLQLTEISADEIVDPSITLVKILADKKNITFKTEIEENLEALLADLRRSKQIILNLLTNATKYTRQNGVIHVNVYRQNDTHARFEIIDDGVGIEKHQLDAIFTEFYQVDRLRDEALGGTGIGLALSKRLVELQNGNIGVESKIGKGSKFWFTLPIHPKKIITSLPKEKEKITKHARSSDILLVEDNEINVALILDILSVDQHKVVIAKNGKEALDFAQTFKPDLILMDMQMPVMDGFEATKAIRALPGYSNTPIIGLSASADEDSVKKQLDAGCTMHLAKPVTPQRLFDVLNDYLPSANELPLARLFHQNKKN